MNMLEKLRYSKDHSNSPRNNALKCVDTCCSCFLPYGWSGNHEYLEKNQMNHAGLRGCSADKFSQNIFSSEYYCLALMSVSLIWLCGTTHNPKYYKIIFFVWRDRYNLAVGKCQYAWKTQIFKGSEEWSQKQSSRMCWYLLQLFLALKVVWHS